MPAPQASAMQQLARAKFMSFALKVPTNWQDPSGDPAAKQYGQAFSDSEKATVPGTPPLFIAASANKYHTDTQKMLIAKIGSFLDQTCSAICSAWSTWQSTVTMSGIIINGPAISLGQLVGAPWQMTIMGAGAVSTPNLMKFTKVIASVISQAWTMFQSSVTFASPFPAFPAFAAFPGPVAPPIPSQVPIPFMSLFQVPVSLQAALLKTQMIGQLGDPQAPFAPQIFEAISTAFEQCFDIWKTTTIVTKIMGTGPIPTFAPPFVPVGPVVMGTGNMLPTGLV
jgi:hypothetical protein